MNTSLLPQDASAEEPRSRLMRVYLRTLGAVCVLGGVLLWFQPPGITLAQHLVLALVFGGVGTAGLLAPRVADAQRDNAVVAVTGLAILSVTMAAGWVGWGLGAPGLSAYGLVLCLVRAGTSERHGAALAAVAVGSIGFLALAESRGWIAGPGIAGFAPMPVRLAVQLGVLVIAYQAGRVLDHVVVTYVRAAGEREQRFRGLLGIGADAYWETDARMALTDLSRRDAEGHFEPLPLNRAEPQPPWEYPGIEMDAEVLDAMRADMEHRARFRDVPARWRSSRGEVRHVLASGAPRFRPGEGFAGYWGVVRDITTEVKARQALLAVESRYQELFNRMPTALVLHRQGRIVDANPAALRLLGVERIDAVMNQPLLRWYEPGDSFQRALEVATQLEAMAPGESMPLEDYRLVTQGQRRAAVRAGGVRVTTDDGPATLSFFVDDTERRAAQEAMRRSQELLVRVVAMSPDVITLTDLSNGRYEMVNASFVRVTGWLAAEVVGRTAGDIGIWRTPADRERLVQLLRERESVQEMAVEFLHRDGRVLPMRVSATRFDLEGRPYLVINARDMSEVEHARLEREAILDNAFIGIALTRDQRFVVANPRFEQMFGWDEGTLAGQHGAVVWPSQERYEEIGRTVGPRLARGEPVEMDGPMMRRDGSTFDCRILGKAVNPLHPSGGGTIWIAEDITERRQTERALARARDDAEAANRAKSDFLANTSHEIRTPLNALVGLAHLAREPGLDDPLRRRYLDQISDSAEALSAIISDILDLSRIEAGKLALEQAPFALRELLESLRSAYAALADARGLGFALEVDDAVPHLVMGDALRLRQILSNFLNNALKFTAAGSVTLRATALEGERVRFEVEDTGCGIDAATQARLFHPFTQADASTTRRFGGTGLGLSICRELTALMGGRVGVASTPGAGSRFWAELPLPPAPEGRADSGFGALDAQPLAGRRVLVVEDNPVNMMITVAMLQRWGAEVGQAEDGAQALEAVARAQARGQPFDAVLMDVQMPGMSGHEATRELRRRQGSRDLPIVALTAAALESEREQALAMGMNDFITKPIDARRLCDTLVRVLEQAAHRPA